jgi:hypothetical protein
MPVIFKTLLKISKLDIQTSNDFMLAKYVSIN